MRLQVTFENICKMFVSRDPSPLTDKIFMVVCFHETCARDASQATRVRDAGQATRARAKQSRLPGCAPTSG